MLSPIDFVAEREGEWGETPNDRGGRTRWGISSKAFPKVNLDELTLEGAKEIYRTEFWEPLRASEVHPAAGLVLLDWAIHSGVPRVARKFQTAVGAAPDGRIGPKTIARAKAYAPKELVERLLLLRLDHILDICEADPTQPLQGWLNRVVLLSVEAAARLS